MQTLLPSSASAPAAQSENRLSRGLAAVIRVTDQLLGCPDEDTLLRRGVELAREQLGVERFAIFLDEPDTDEMVGTYGTDMQGQTTQECEFRIPMGDLPRITPSSQEVECLRWVYHDRENLQAGDHQNNGVCDRLWMVATPIFSSSGRLGVAFQDAAISQSPADPTLLDIVTVYCSVLGSMIESKRAAEAARQSQRQTSEGLGAVLDIADELVLCEDLDCLLQRAVEMARDRLGIERLGIFLENGTGQSLSGTYGIDREGHLRDERAMTVGVGALDMPKPASKNALSRLKIYEAVSADDDVNTEEVERRSRDWVVSTPIQSSQGVIGICFNDNALTKHPLDESQQEKLAVFCSMLGNMIENKRATQAMRESQRSLATLMGNLPGIAYRCRNDAAWTMEVVSDGALELTGYPATSLVGKGEVNVVHLIHPDDRELVRAGVEAALEANTRYQLTYRMKTATGQEKWVFDQGGGVFGADGELEALEGFIGDITARKQAEEELREAKDELETRVAARTAELALANEQLRFENLERQSAMATLHEFAEALRLSKEEAERANGAKSEFLSRMSHELRTPLNAILGFGQVLEMGQLEPKQRDSTAHILRAGQHLLGLINEVLDISRVEAGHLEVALEAVAVEAVVAECCALVEPLAAERGIRLNWNGSPSVSVLADHQRLKQVLLNLLSNAIKYNVRGGQVSLSCSVLTPNRVGIEVRDTGVGLSAGDLTKLFNPFERLHAANSEIEGTGLGLVLAKRLSQAMGGDLRVQSQQSEVGRGSTFTIELPSALPLELPGALPAAPNAAETLAAEATPSDQTALCPPRRVLVIEDNLSNLRLMEVIFEGRPHIQLVAAMQGSVGLDLARQHQPDLILLDLNLPDMSGRDVLARLQESPLTREVPVLIISADATPQQIERLLADGAKRYLTKPLNVKEFLSVVDEFVSEGARCLSTLWSFG